MYDAPRRERRSLPPAPRFSEPARKSRRPRRRSANTLAALTIPSRAPGLHTPLVRWRANRGPRRAGQSPCVRRGSGTGMIARGRTRRGRGESGRCAACAGWLRLRRLLLAWFIQWSRGRGLIAGGHGRVRQLVRAAAITTRPSQRLTKPGQSLRNVDTFRLVYMLCALFSIHTSLIYLIPCSLAVRPQYSVFA